MKITLCGSIAFYPEIKEAQDTLAARGMEVAIPELSREAPPEYGGGTQPNFGRYMEEHGGMDAFPAGHPLWDLKGSAIWDHLEKITWCDAVVVINPEKRGVTGYIGGNTLIEMGVAFYLKKKNIHAPSRFVRTLLQAGNFGDGRHVFGGRSLARRLGIGGGARRRRGL